MKQLRYLPLLLILVFATTAYGQDKKELAKAAQNPLASMISLPFQNNTSFGYGPDDDVQNTLDIQPILPFKLTDELNLITRTILPVVTMPSIVPGDDSSTTGLGDTTVTGWFSPSAVSKWSWGVGPSLVVPTSTDDALGTGEWGAGVSAILLTMPGDWVVGALISNVWNIEGDDDFSLFTFQPIINYNLHDGWYLASVPIITANWDVDSDQRWTVPLGAGVGKIFHIGKQPINMSTHAYYNVEKPDYVGDWTLRIQFQFMFPK